MSTIKKKERKEMTRRKHKTLTLKEKLQLLSEAKVQTKSALSSKFGCSLETVNRILRSEKDLIELSKSNKLLIKRNRSGTHKNVEDALKLWYDQMRSAGAPVSTNLLLETAQALAVQLNESFNPSVGWLWRWQRREGVQLRKIKKKDQSANTEEEEEPPAAIAYKEMINRDFLASYQATDVFSADETGLLYKALPLENVGGGSKERLTVLLICNATGDYKKAFVIGKPRSPKCKTIPIKYYSNKKAWMTQQIWSDILRIVNEEMAQQSRKIIMFVDNAAVHQNVQGLTNIELHFLLPNKTCHTPQPFDLGILHTFKFHYRKNIISRQKAALEGGNTVDEFLKSLDLIKAINIINDSWSLVPPGCIRKCFKKAGLLPESEGSGSLSASGNTEEYLFSTDEGGDESFNEYIDCDANVPCYGKVEESILPDASPGQRSEVDGEKCEQDETEMDQGEDEEEEHTEEEQSEASSNPIPAKDLLAAVELLERHFQGENKFSGTLEEMRGHIIAKKGGHAKQT